MPKNRAGRPSSSPAYQLIGHRDDDLPLGTSRFELRQRISDTLKGVQAVENYLDRTGANKTAKFGQVLATRMHEEVAVMRPVPARATPQGKARNPKQRLQPEPTPHVLRCR